MWRRLASTAFVASSLTIFAGRQSRTDDLGSKLYVVRDDKVDAMTYNGFRRYHAGCNHCHGPDGIGSTFAPSLVARGTSAMPGYADDPNFALHIDDKPAPTARSGGGGRNGSVSRSRFRTGPSRRSASD